MQQGNVSVEVLVHGKPIREFPHNGETWVEGRKDSEYSLRVRNNTSKRVEVVMTVDGLSIMDGQPGDFNTRGYAIDAFQTVVIPGWRRSDDNVAKFVFAAVEESYAEKTGQAGNIGVIGCAVFEELIQHHLIRPMHLGGFNNMRGGDEMLGTSMDMMSKGIGTGYGRETEHRVSRTEFRRATPKPAEVFMIRYADRKGLKKAGVNLKPVAVIVDPAKAKPFPAEPKPQPQPSCPPPPGWKK